MDIHHKAVKPAGIESAGTLPALRKDVQVQEGLFNPIKSIEQKDGRALTAPEIRGVLLKNGVKERSVLVNVNGTGISVYYLEAGDSGKPTIVLIHGGGNCSSLNWKYQIPELSKHFHVVAPDLVGYGNTAEPQGHKATLRYHEDFVMRFMDSLHIDTAGLVGNSMGGGVSAGIAARYPAMVSKIFLIAPHNVSEIVHSALITAVSNVAKWLPLSVDKDLFKIKWVSEKAGGKFAEAFWQFIRGDDFNKSYSLSQLRVPVMLVHGSNDRILKRKNAVPESEYKKLGPELSVNRMQIESGISCLEILRAGHGPQYEHPDFINSEIIAYFSPQSKPEERKIKNILHRIFRK